MSTQELFIAILCGVSITLIIGKSTIFAPLRSWIKSQAQTGKGCWVWLDKLINCQQCLGFWSGAFVGLVAFDFSGACVCALLVSLASVWNDFCIGALARMGSLPTSSQAKETIMHHYLSGEETFEQRQRRAEEMVGLREKVASD